jgi:photosystem II stability/assembly factor-like uncharacterized protein
MKRLRLLVVLFLAACGSNQKTGAMVGSDGGNTELPDRPTPPMPPDPCIAAGTCPPGQWLNVTPSGVELTAMLDCGNFGTESVYADPSAPANVYVQFNCQGIYKSTDYGLTWHGPINTGMNGKAAGDAAGGITIPSASTTEPPVIYSSGIRGSGTGFWRSTNGGVDWTNYPITPGGSRQDFYPPDTDPYDANHLVMSGHENDLYVESMDGGQTWTKIPTDPGQKLSGGTAGIFFIDTGNPATTRTTWLWIGSQGSGPTGPGTWRTTNSGAAWTKVDGNERPHSTSQLYQPDSKGVLYMAGAYSKLGWGILRSTDYGQTWAHVGSNANETLVFGTPKNVYAMYGWAAGAGTMSDPAIQVGAQPGTGSFMTNPQPSGMYQGPGRVAVTSDGHHSVFLAACYNAGLWRYVEP